MNKNSNRVWIILLLVLAAFCTAALVLPFKKNAVFWTAFGFAVLSILLQSIVMGSAFGDKKGARSKFYGFPTAKIGLVYLIVQLVLSLIFMAASGFVPIWIVAVSSLLVLIVFSAGFIAADGAREEIIRQDEKLHRDTSCITTLRSVAYSLVSYCKGAKASKAVKDLADEFRYSDPVSSDELRPVEANLEDMMEKLQKMVFDGKEEDVPEMCGEISRVLGERNRLCRLNKRNA